MGRGLLGGDGMIRVPGDTADESTVEGAFVKENPYAAATIEALGTVEDAAARARVLATLALAYEAREARYCLDDSLANRIEHWIRP